MRGCARSSFATACIATVANKNRQPWHTAMTDLTVKLSHVGKDYPFFSLNDVSFDIPRGSITGYIGRNGAGKSTTIRIILGLLRQDRGEVEVLGHPMPVEQKAAKWDIGFVSEDMRLYANATLEWHLRFIKSIYPNWDEGHARKLLKRLDLNVAQKIDGMSHGQRVKAALLLALARHPRLLLLDEPTTGLDPVARREILAEIEDVLADGADRSVLFSSHNTLDVEKISNQVAFIDRGRIIQCGDKDAFLDRWRRLRLQVPAGKELPALAGIIDVKRDGLDTIAITNAYRVDLQGAFDAAGVLLKAVEPLSLEEIFLASVDHNTENSAA
jgi:ABC-2 type transport system ATP-binding protein